MIANGEEKMRLRRMDTWQLMNKAEYLSILWRILEIEEGVIGRGG